MKNFKLIFGSDPQALRRQPEGAAAPLTVQELARLGIPARKIPRVRAELARLCALDPALCSRATLFKLARQLEKQFL